MKNKIFYGILSIMLLITILFVCTPLFLLIVKGVFSIKEAFFNITIQKSIALSFATSLISTFIVLIFSIPVSYFLSKFKNKLTDTLSFIIFAPISLPHIVSGIALLLFLGNRGIGQYLSKYNIDFVFTRSGIVAAEIFVNLPFMIKNLKNSFENIDKKMEFVARTLGADEMSCFRYITLPLLKKDIISSTVITFSKALGEFGAVMMLAGAGEKTLVMPTNIFMSMSTGELDIAIATACILIAVSLISTILFEFLSKEKNTDV